MWTPVAEPVRAAKVFWEVRFDLLKSISSA